MVDGRVFKRPVVAVTLLAAAFCGGTNAQDGEDEEDAPRAIVQCLSHPTIDRTKILNDRNIVFVTRNDTIYHNELPKQCPSLRRNSLVNYAIANGRVCGGDKLQVLWEVRPGNYSPAFLCELGTFRSISATELKDLVSMTEEKREQRRRGRSRREAVTSEEVELPHTEAAPADAGTAPAQ